jgi:hypothetical protein
VQTIGCNLLVFHNSSLEYQVDFTSEFNAQNSNINIALIVPAISGSGTLSKFKLFTPFFIYLLPSVTRTTKNSQGFLFTFYLGFDEGDALFDNHRKIESFKHSFRSIIQNQPIALKVSSSSSMISKLIL